MELNNASKLGDLHDIVDNVELFSIIVKFILPLIIILLSIEFIKALKKASKRKLQRNEIKKQQDKEKAKQQKMILDVKKKKRQRINNLYKDDEFLMKQLEGTHEPFDKSAYHDLDLIFGKNGKVIK